MNIIFAFLRRWTKHNFKMQLLYSLIDSKFGHTISLTEHCKSYIYLTWMAFYTYLIILGPAYNGNLTLGAYSHNTLILALIINSIERMDSYFIWEFWGLIWVFQSAGQAHAVDRTQLHFSALGELVCFEAEHPAWLHHHADSSGCAGNVCHPGRWKLSHHPPLGYHGDH